MDHRHRVSSHEGGKGAVPTFRCHVLDELGRQGRRDDLVRFGLGLGDFQFGFCRTLGFGDTFLCLGFGAFDLVCDLESFLGGLDFRIEGRDDRFRKSELADDVDLFDHDPFAFHGFFGPIVEVEHHLLFSFAVDLFDRQLAGDLVEFVADDVPEERVRDFLDAAAVGLEQETDFVRFDEVGDAEVSADLQSFDGLEADGLIIR